MISVSHSPPSSTEVMKQDPERSGSTTREHTPVSGRVSPSQEPIECRIRLTCPRYLDLESDGEMSVDSDPAREDIENALKQAQPVLESLRTAANSEFPHSVDDPTEINIRGRFVSVNSLMGAGPDHGCVE